MISAESDAPYDRPPLSKKLWKGETLSTIWRKMNGKKVEILLGRVVTKLDLKQKRVVDDKGDVFTHTKLLLATGGRPRLPPQDAAFEVRSGLVVRFLVFFAEQAPPDFLTLPACEEQSVGICSDSRSRQARASAQGTPEVRPLRNLSDTISEWKEGSRWQSLPVLLLWPCEQRWERLRIPGDIRDCIEIVKKKGAKSIADDFMAEAARLSLEKRSVELEKDKLQIDISYRENVVADKQVIADSLLRFESVVKSLPPDEQKDLVQLILREISVKHFDPNVDQVPREPGVFSTKIRTKWIFVNISLFASDLLQNTYKSGEISSDLKKIGSAGVGKIRTCWNLNLTLGIPFSRWGAQPFIVQPVPFPAGILEDLAPSMEKEPQVQKPRMHPFLLAQWWRHQLDHDTRLTRARIAAREGISRARVTQVMNLLQLPAEVQASLLKPPAPLEIHSFSERRLRALVSCGDEASQTSRWRELVEELKGSIGN